MSRPDTPFDLEAYLDGERTRVATALEGALSRITPPLPVPVARAMEHGVLSGGKALRPILCVAAYRAGRQASHAGEEPPGLYALAVALELVHSYSLMHDDLPCMDDAALRRGRPTTHRVHGERATILAGAALIPAAMLQVLEGARQLGLDADRAAMVARELCRAAGAGGMVGGQVLDLLGEGRRLDAVALDELHGLKTGALLAGALHMGGLAANAPVRVLSALGEYGRAVGLAFQIADDLLDATGSAEALGKNPSDSALGKSTYVTLWGVERARQRAFAEEDRARGALTEAGLPASIEAAAPLHALASYAVNRGH